jgi:phosphohistidine phosphatase
MSDRAASVAPRTLILLRHAAAANPGRFSDHDRPLTDAGMTDAAAAGAWLAANLPPIDVVLCSTAKRARQTWTAMGLDAPVEYLEELYGAGIDDVVEILAETPAEARTVLVVGHAPTMPATAQDLASIAELTASEPGPDSAERAGEVAAEPTEAEPPATAATADMLRSFSACALAVLRPHGDWNQLAERGAALLQVRRPGE